ncbi:MAG: endonuclease/exonuclease/phosphatase family protein [Fimbriimonadaceae bacterium]
MRIVTFNIRNGAADDGKFAWPHRVAPFLALLGSLDADVLCLQEVLDFQLEAIVASLPDHRFVGVGRDDGRRGGEFVPIFYRNLDVNATGTLWLSESPTTPGSIAWGARLPRICTWAKFGNLTIANVHLDHESQEARTRGMELILRSLDADVVCGDFNAEPGEPCLAVMAACGYADRGIQLGGTFNNFEAEPRRAPRIDYIFARSSWAGTAEVQRNPLVSDHWPVLAQLLPTE